MKRIVAQYPYDEYYLYVIFHKKEGRRYANLIPIDKQSGLKRKTISYARYLMSVKEKRILNKKEYVDHIDNDKLNDDINNLQLLSLKENNIKESKRRGKKMVLLKCPQCNIIFTREKRQTHLQKGGQYTGCCRKCSSKFGALLWNHPNNVNLLKALDKNVIREYTRH